DYYCQVYDVSSHILF
nr:immunoglobulin light chain junction region [Macaca mulatta]MOX17813.1 immunoglobulin light chain junction region [Macaca mulatta]MOX19085.1 immunoglobulin light chain junction region [Macaca mulatta]MOX19798.1 immunoglobulin light chain junction region [Macaca mulatta]MOX19945.1 immunoglobulin light chain junction region [Macaca mulatta]